MSSRLLSNTSSHELESSFCLERSIASTCCVASWTAIFVLYSQKQELLIISLDSPAKHETHINSSKLWVTASTEWNADKRRGQCIGPT